MKKIGILWILAMVFVIVLIWTFPGNNLPDNGMDHDVICTDGTCEVRTYYWYNGNTVYAMYADTVSMEQLDSVVKSHERDILRCVWKLKKLNLLDEK